MPDPDRIEGTASRREAKETAFDGTHPQWEEFRNRAKSAYVTAMMVMENPTRFHYDTPSNNTYEYEIELGVRVREGSAAGAYTCQPAMVFFDSQREAFEGLSRALEKAIKDPNSGPITRIADPVEDADTYNLGSRVNIIGLDPSRLSGEDQPTRLPVQLRISWPVSEFPADIAASIKERYADLYPTFHDEPYAPIPPIGRVSFDIETFIESPQILEVQEEASPDGVRMLAGRMTGKALEDLLSETDTRVFREQLGKVIEGSQKEHSRLEQELAISTGQDKRDTGVNARDRAATLAHAGAVTGIEHGASLGIALKALHGIIEQGLSGENNVQLGPVVHEDGKLLSLDETMPPDHRKTAGRSGAMDGKLEVRRLRTVLEPGIPGNAILEVQPHIAENTGFRAAAKQLSRIRSQGRER